MEYPLLNGVSICKDDIANVKVPFIVESWLEQVQMLRFWLILEWREHHPTGRVIL